MQAPSGIHDNDNVVRLDSACQRYHERLPKGVSVTWQGKPLVLANWSLGGLGLIYPQCPWNSNTRISLVLHIMLEDCSFPMPVTASVVRYHVDSQQLGLRFEDLPLPVYHSLRHVFFCLKNDTPVTLDSLMQAYHQRPVKDAAKVFHATSRALKKQWNIGKLASYASVLMLAIAVFYLLWQAISAQLFALPAVYAAVSAPVYTVTAPADGLVETLGGLSDENIRRGDPILRIINPKQKASIDILRAKMDLQQERIAILQQQLGSAENFFTGYTKVASQKLRAESASIAGWRASVAARKKELERLQALRKKKYVSAQAVDQAKADLAQTTATLNRLLANIAAASTERELASRQFYVTGNNAIQGSPHDVRQAIALAEAEYRNMEAELNIAMQEQGRMDITSPCNCRLGQRYISEDTWVKTGSKLLDLQGSRPEDMIIEARVLQADAERLIQEGRADILLPDRKNVITGYVSSIRRLPPTDPRTGLPVDIAHNTDYATVLLRTTDQIPANLAGLPAQVIFDLSHRNPFVRLMHTVKVY